MRAERPVRHRTGDRLLRPRRQELGFPVEFAYPSVTAIVPANIGSSGREERRGRQAFRELHPLGRGPAAAPRSEDLAPSSAARHVRQGAARISEPLRRHDPGEGQLRLEPVGGALLRRVVRLRPGHHFPPQGAGGGDQGHPGRRKAARRPLQRAARGSQEARMDASPHLAAGAGKDSSRFQGEERRRGRHAPQDAARGGMEHRSNGNYAGG